MKFLITAFAAGMLLLQVSCTQNSESAFRKHEELNSMDIAEAASSETAADFSSDTSFIPAGNKQVPAKVKNQSPVAAATWDKKIVKQGTLNLEVKDFKSFDKKFRNRVTAAGGYIASEEQHNNEYKIEEVISIKVPVDQFDEVVQLIADDGDKIIEKRISSEDVTGSIFDTRSRMEAKRNVRLRYMDLLKQANKMNDILEVEKEINGIQQEIEAAAGRINYLSHASAYSTINLSFFQVLNPSIVIDEQPSFFADVKNAFGRGARWSGDLFVALVSIWPLWLAGILIWAALRKMKPAKIKSV